MDTNCPCACVADVEESSNHRAASREKDSAPIAALPPTLPEQAQASTSTSARPPFKRADSVDSPSAATSNTADAGFEISSAWSVAGIGTCIQLRHRAFGLHIAMDIGTSAGETLGAGHIFVSHGHIDHIGALLNHARARTLSNKPAKYYVPVPATEPLLRAKAAYEALDGCAFNAEIVGVEPGDICRIHPNVRVEVFPTKHRVPSQGYAIIREKSKGLKAGCRNLSSHELARRRKQGESVVELEDIVEVAYTGDTILKAVLDQPLVRQARLLILECTYLEGEIVWAHSWHHVHMQEIVKHAAAFASNERVVCCHVSRKYKRWDNVLRCFQSGMAPVPALAAKIGVTLAGFGRTEPVTWLVDYQQEQAAAAMAAAAAAAGEGGSGSPVGHAEGPHRGPSGGNVHPRREKGGADLEDTGAQSVDATPAEETRWMGSNGGLKDELPEVKTKEEANRMLRVLSEDLGLRPRVESLLNCSEEQEEEQGQGEKRLQELKGEKRESVGKGWEVTSEQREEESSLFF
ncbi:hypothetical protein NSK_003046 [Nannochloropsis salina CCMP1776]|uniref:Metallo-beta-lactamase domain-containing protein n=1 Tax=Nannochloropsis salina CCMP1776 TaxID=1027361 RepID=A0A4D9D594_9STRA|nr:hypothetical protein NSK_003046 [Nannochloropsis salina CCMP1776]|eukprot:TFJ85537.1 hypothetical protein NSK_003046 [Nannochloropsis salina CCMP1776]